MYKILQGLLKAAVSLVASPLLRRGASAAVIGLLLLLLSLLLLPFSAPVLPALPMPAAKLAEMLLPPTPSPVCETASPSAALPLPSLGCADAKTLLR